MKRTISSEKSTKFKSMLPLFLPSTISSYTFYLLPIPATPLLHSSTTTSCTPSPLSVPIYSCFSSVLFLLQPFPCHKFIIYPEIKERGHNSGKSKFARTARNGPLKARAASDRIRGHGSSQQTSGSDSGGGSDTEDAEVDTENEHVGESIDEDSLAEVQRTKSATNNTVEPQDETKSHMMEDEEGVAPKDTFHERYVKKISEDLIRAQIKAYPSKTIIYLFLLFLLPTVNLSQFRYEAVATKSVVLSHKLLGTVLAVGAIASGQEWAVGLAREGIEQADWLANDATPSPGLSEYGVRRRLLSSFTKASGRDMTPHQLALSSLLLSYADVAYHCETTDNHMEIVQCYILHALNHVCRYAV